MRRLIVVFCDTSVNVEEVRDAGDAKDTLVVLPVIMWDDNDTRANRAAMAAVQPLFPCSCPSFVVLEPHQVRSYADLQAATHLLVGRIKRECDEQCVSLENVVGICLAENYEFLKDMWMKMFATRQTA